MTLIVAVPAQDAVILGSDSEVVIGEVRSQHEKIFQLNTTIAWGASGNTSIVQKVGEQIQANKIDFANKTLLELRPKLTEIVGQTISSSIEVDVRFNLLRETYRNNPDKIFELMNADFLFVEYKDQPWILHILATGQSEWVQGRCAASGSGSMSAYALLQKYVGRSLVCSTAKLLAYKIIEEAIPVASWGLGEPIDIWEAKADGVKKCEEAEIAALKASAEELRSMEVSWLVNGIPPTNTPQT